MRILDDFSIVAGRLTRLPLFPRDDTSSERLAEAWRAAPAVGALIGLVAGGAYWVANLLSFSTLTCAVVASAVLMAAYRGRREGAIAEAAESLLGPDEDDGRNLGAVGLAMTLLTVLLQVALIESIAEPSRVIAALITMGAVGHGAWVVAYARWPHSEGETAPLDQPTEDRATFAMLLTLGIAVLTGWVWGLVAAGLAGLAALVAMNILKKHQELSREPALAAVAVKAEMVTLLVYAAAAASASGLARF